MKFPSKVTPYKESTIAMFPLVLKYLENQDMSPSALYSKIKKKVTDIREFTEILECLFALNKIEFNGEVLHYVG